MSSINQKNNTFLSIGFTLFTFAVMALLYYGNPDIERSYFTLALVPVLDLVAIMFAVRSMKLNESSWAGSYLGIIGILNLGFILYIASFIII